ncbi:MAG: DsbA family protein [Gammaproteobacteria bacterium]
MKRPLLALIAGAAALLVQTQGYAAAAPQVSPAERQKIESIIQDYLLNNPQILLEASKKLQQQEQAKLQDKVRQSIATHARDLFFTAANPIAGNPNGTLTLVEFFDYQCGHCKTMDPIVLGLIKKNPQLRIIFKPWPIFGANSEYAAKAVLAAHEQGKYLPLHVALMKIKGELSPALILETAKSVGLNTKKLESDMKDVGYAQQLHTNSKLATELGSQGTPTFVLAALDPQMGPPPANSDENNIRAVFIPGGTSQAILQKLIDELGKKS